MRRSTRAALRKAAPGAATRPPMAGRLPGLIGLVAGLAALAIVGVFIGTRPDPVDPKGGQPDPAGSQPGMSAGANNAGGAAAPGGAHGGSAPGAQPPGGTAGNTPGATSGNTPGGMAANPSGATPGDPSGGMPGHTHTPPRFQMPITPGPILSRFGPRGDDDHEGIDIKGPKGALVQPVAQGFVVRVQTREQWEMRQPGSPGHAAGAYVEIVHDDGWMSRYMHLDLVYAYEGQRIGIDHPVGTLGRTGVERSETHLHFELRLPAQPSQTRGAAVDPLHFLPRW